MISTALNTEKTVYLIATDIFNTDICNTDICNAAICNTDICNTDICNTGWNTIKIYFRDYTHGSRCAVFRGGMQM